MEELYCPKDGTKLVPSNKFPAPGWWGCETCGRVYGEPEWKNQGDLGVTLEPYKDFNPSPGGHMARKGKSSNAKGVPKKDAKRQRVYFPLPLPLQGQRVVPKND